MPPEDWMCDWCGFGPLPSSNDVHCCRSGHRLRDSHSTVSSLPSNTWNAGPNSQSEDPGAHSVSAVNTEPVLSGAAAKAEAPIPERSSVNLSPAKSVSSKDSKAVVAVSSGTLGWAPDDVITHPIQPSSEQKAASQGASEIRQDPSVNLSKDNGSQIGSADKWSRLIDYLSINAEDPWNHEWVVYGARTPLPGESSYSLKTGEPATTTPRRPYDAIRRAEVAFTRNNGGACEPCRRRHQKCPHRLQELARIIGDDGTTSERAMEGGVTRRELDAVGSEVAAAIGSSTQLGGAINPESSEAATLFVSTPRRELSQRRSGHRGTSAGPSEHLSLEASQRPQASYASPTLENEFGTTPGRPDIHEGPHIPRFQPTRRSARHRHGSNVTSQSCGSNRQSNNAASQEASGDYAASMPLEETYSLGSTRRGTEEPSYMSHGAGLRSFPPLPYDEQQSLLSEQMFATQPDSFDIVSDQETTLPYEGFTWSEGDYANLGGTRARSLNVTDPPRSSSRNHFELIPVAVADESSSPFFRPSETPFWPSQQASLGRDYFNEQAVEITLPMRRSSLPQTHLNQELMSVPEVQEALPNRSDENLGWQIEDGSLLDATPPELTFGTALPDVLFAAPDQGGDHHATHLPSAIDANSQPAGPYEWIDTDLAADLAWNNLYYGGVDRSIDPASGSYVAYSGDPFVTDDQENTSWSNSDPIPTPPSDETG